MRNAIGILKSGQGVFASAAKKITLGHYPVAYVGIAHDKQNLMGDMVNVCSDVRKAADEAHLKTKK
jgi:hypothetical protein